MANSVVQNDILKELFNISLSKAADSLSFFIRNKIFIKDLQLDSDNPSNIELISEQFNDANVVLKTSIKGEFTAETYLLFSDQDITNFFKVAHPINPDAKLEDELSREFLLEVDNILTASVVTELSNILDIGIYGDVPQLVTDTQAIKQQLSSDPESVRCLQVIARYVSDGLVIEPRFIWFIDRVFLERMRVYAEDQENIMASKSLRVSS